MIKTILEILIVILFLSFFIGCVIELSSFFRSSHKVNYGAEQRAKPVSNKLSALKSRRNRAIAGIIALVVKSDKVVDKKEVERVEKYIQAHYSGNDRAEMLKLLKVNLSINNDKFVKQSCIWLRDTLSYSECLGLTEFLFDIACLSGNLNKREWILLADVMNRLCLEQDDIEYLSHKYAAYYRGENASRQSGSSSSSEFSADVRSKEARMDNAYRLLGVQYGASANDIQSAFRRLAKKYHPDTVQDEQLKKVLTEKFKEISAAYNYLNG